MVPYNKWERMRLFSSFHKVHIDAISWPLLESSLARDDNIVRLLCIDEISGGLRPSNWGSHSSSVWLVASLEMESGALEEDAHKLVWVPCEAVCPLHSWEPPGSVSLAHQQTSSPGRLYKYKIQQGLKTSSCECACLKTSTCSCPC